MYIRTKIRIATSVIGALIVACIGLSIMSYHQNNAAHAARTSAGQLASANRDLNALVTEFLVHPTARVRDQWVSRFQALQGIIEEIAPDTDAANRFTTDISIRADAMARAYDQLSAFSWDPGNETVQRARRILTSRMLAESEAMNTLADDYLRAAEERMAEAHSRLFLSLIGLAVVATLAFVAVTAITCRGIVAPVIGLGRAVDRMGRGDLESPIESHAKDEIGDLARHIDDTRSQLRRTQVSQRAIADLLRYRERELEQQAADLQRSNDDLARFAYTASHDLKTPLRGIDNLAQWIEEDAGDVLPEATRGYLEKMQQRIKRMERLLEDLLAYAQAGSAATRPEQVDTRRLAEQVVDMIDPPAGYKVAIASQMPVLRTARIPLQQVFAGLINNAVQHHDRPSGHIAITASETHDGWRFSVSDDGPGIPKEFHNRVFEMFQTLKPKDEIGSTGMGLALVRRLTERQGGRVWIESDGDERGATINVDWPVAADTSAEDAFEQVAVTAA